MRVSKHQIIWGGNYFPLPETQGFVIWDKCQPENFSLAMVEFAWSSIQSPAKMFRYSVQNEKSKIHPTQKPVRLYQWLLSKYAKPGDTILDTHHGSGSNAIACLDMGFNITAYEIRQRIFWRGLWTYPPGATATKISVVVEGQGDKPLLLLKSLDIRRNETAQRGYAWGLFHCDICGHDVERTIGNGLKAISNHVVAIECLASLSMV